MFFIHRHELDAALKKVDRMVMPFSLVFYCDRSLVPENVLDFLYFINDQDVLFDCDEYSEDGNSLTFNERIAYTILYYCRDLVQNNGNYHYEKCMSFYINDTQYNIYHVGQVYPSMMAHTSPHPQSKKANTKTIDCIDEYYKWLEDLHDTDSNSVIMFRVEMFPLLTRVFDSWNLDLPTQKNEPGTRCTLSIPEYFYIDKNGNPIDSQRMTRSAIYIGSPTILHSFSNYLYCHQVAVSDIRYLPNLTMIEVDVDWESESR